MLLRALVVLSLCSSCAIAVPTIRPPHATNDGYVVAFTDGDDDGWKTWNMKAITHLGFWSAPKDDVRAAALANGVRLFQDSHLPDPKDWSDEGKRKDWVQEKVDQVQSNKLNGVFFDEESHLSSDQQKDYVKLAQETSDALAKINATIFICVGGRPTYEGRDYDYKGLAASSEFLFIMGYDMHFWDDYTCVTKHTCSPAEASIKDLSLGVSQYLSLVDASKLVLGLPWYGQLYEVIAVPWNMGQVKYADVLSVMDKTKIKSKSLDNDSMTWKLDCEGACISGKKGGTIWFDDATTLAPKYKLAKDNNLKGVGVWEISNAPYPDGSKDKHQDEREAMWKALANWQQ